MEDDESESVHKNINKQKDTKNGTEYKESSVTNEALRYSNINKYGKNILNRLHLAYEQACMATTKDEYYTKMLETPVDYNAHNNSPLFNEKIGQAVSRFMSETDEK